jgi:hypothetical protein
MPMASALRLTSTGEVLHAAGEAGKRLLEVYEWPPANPAEMLLQYAKGKGNLDPTREFAEACRLERAKALRHV